MPSEVLMQSVRICQALCLENNTNKCKKKHLDTEECRHANKTILTILFSFSMSPGIQAADFSLILTAIALS